VNEFKLLRPDSDENLVSDCKKLVDEKFGSLDKIDYDRSKIKDSFKDEKGDDQWKEILFYVLVKLTNKHELLKQRYKYGFDNIKWLYNKSIEENLPDYIKKVSENTNQSDATYSKCLTWINDFAKKSNGKQDAILYFLNALSDKDEKKIINLYIEYKKKDFAAFEEIDKLNLKEEYWDNLFNIKENSVLAKAFKQTFIYFYNENNVVKKADEKNFDDVISIKHIVDNFNFKEINDTKTNWKKSYNSDQLKFMKLTDKYVDFMHLKYNDFDGFWEKAFDKLDVNKIKRDDKLNDEEDTKLIPLYDLCVALHTKNDKDVLTACQKYANGCESFRNGNRKNGEKFYDDIDYISAFSKDQKAQQLTNDYVLLSKLRYGFVLISDIALYLALEEYLGPDNKCSGFKIRADYSGKTSTLSRVSKEIISQAKINLKK
jgi:hypothetical protein